jgi:hypothetical protein
MGTIISEIRQHNHNARCKCECSIPKRHFTGFNGTEVYIHRFDVFRDDELLQVSVELPYFFKVSYPPDLNEA